MMRTAYPRVIIATTTFCCVSVVVFAEPAPPKNLDDVFAPVVVGTPPVNAFNGLFRCPDGAIRHYGDEGFLFSRDNGLTWKYHRLIMVRPPYFLPSRPRVLFAAHGARPYRITVFRSDGGGLTWAKTVLPPGPAFEVEPPHKGPRWENWYVEPTILELKDGRLWMLARTSRDNHHECFSEDDGETWSARRRWRPDLPGRPFVQSDRSGRAGLLDVRPCHPGRRPHQPRHEAPIRDRRFGPSQACLG